MPRSISKVSIHSNAWGMLYPAGRADELNGIGAETDEEFDLESKEDGDVEFASPEPRPSSNSSS